MEHDPHQQPESTTQRLPEAMRPLQAGAAIGPYQLIEQLGAGGMGEVFKATQSAPLRRTVALKIIRLGFATNEVIARFEAERQALARLDHPHIAKVLDAGVTAAGQPYFVMEYVPGLPLVRFADENRLNISERLELFLQVCDAISHAHIKSLVHRDIKSSNVLAYISDGKPTTKVIDFGIAKALAGDRLTEATFHTMRGEVLGTYESMSPEQAAGSPDIDTRTDVYSLGVLLYELLAGVQPFDRETLARAAHHEIRRIISEVEPARPSTRISSLAGTDAGTRIAASRHSQLGALVHELRNELEWIPLHAMRKERQRRYASPQQLAEDIQNYLASRPLLAGPESRSYRVRKFLRRHWRGASAIAAIVLSLAGGVAATTIALVGQSRARAEAELQRVKAEEVVDFLTRHVLAGASPSRIPDKHVRDTIVAAMLDPAAASVGERLAEQPLVEAEVRNALGECYRLIGRADLAVPQARAALELRRQQLGDAHLDTLISRNNLAIAMLTAGQRREAGPVLREAAASSRRHLGDQHKHTLITIHNHAQYLREDRQYDEAASLLAEVAAANERVLPDDDEDKAATLLNLAGVRISQGDLAGAAAALERGAALVRDHFDDAHVLSVRALETTAMLTEARGELASAEAQYREVLRRTREIYGNDHRAVLRALSNLAPTLSALGRSAEAEAMFAELHQRSRALLGPDHPATTSAICELARTLELQGRLREAESLVRGAIDHLDQRSREGADRAETSSAQRLQLVDHLAGVLDAMGRTEAALTLWREALKSGGSASALAPAYLITPSTRFGLALLHHGRAGEAEPLLREARRQIASVHRDHHPLLRQLLEGLIRLCQQTGRVPEAQQWRVELEQFAARRPGS